MNLPTVVTDFINAQNNFDSEASANCFSETGTFPGSPVVLKFHFTLKNNLIDYLKVTG